MLRSLLSDVSTYSTNALASAYNGWIVWNLFLAFIPLTLSLLLFRRNAISRIEFWLICTIVGFMGVLGGLGRIPNLAFEYLSWLQANLVQGGNGSDGAHLQKLLGTSLWLVVLLAVISGFTLLLRRSGLRASIWWWLGFISFIAFLPNAPYVLTDIIHLIQATSHGYLSVWSIVLILIPLHTLAMLVAFEAYVVALLNQGHYLKQHGLAHWILPVEIIAHGLSAVGIYLGRFLRFNSWDLLTHPNDVMLTTLNVLTSRWPLLVISITFVILTVLYWSLKQITLGLKLRIRYAHLGSELLD